MSAVRAYRLDRLSRRYPSFIVAVEVGRWHVQIMNLLHPAWWREWRSPLWAGARWHQARWLLRLVTW